MWICGICDISSPTINDRQTSSSSVKLRISLLLSQSNRSFHWTSLCRRLAKTLYSGFLPEPWCFFIEPLRSSSATTSTTGRVQHRADRPRPTSLTWTEKKCGIFNIWLRKTQMQDCVFFSEGLLSRASVHDLLTCMIPSASRRVGEGALFCALLFIVHHCFYYLFILAASFYAAAKHPTGHFKCCTSDGLAAEGRIGFLASPLPLFFLSPAISSHFINPGSPLSRPPVRPPRSCLTFPSPPTTSPGLLRPPRGVLISDDSELVVSQATTLPPSWRASPEGRGWGRVGRARNMSPNAPLC